jgi:predicted TIM-barrel fold metal-dependent hydrolase
MTRQTLLLTGLLLWPHQAPAQLVPTGDYHQHIFSPAITQLLGTGVLGPEGLPATQLVALLDSAGMRHALLLSVAYMYGSPARTVDSEYARVRAENDWTGAQAALYPGRLIAFCSFNPLKDYALEELARCAADPNLRRGIKLHFGNSDVQLDLADHVERLRGVFRAANERGMAIVLHLRASISRQRPYGAAQARTLLEELLPLAPDVPVQVAHLAGSGPDDDPAADSAMTVLATAVANHDPRARNLWFDVTTVVTPNTSPDKAALVVRWIRQVGVGRILYGSDAPVPGNLPPREGWAAFRRLPLTESEFRAIAANVPPYFR